ncbi:MAG: hypothetical protein JO316_26320 [Abitibacteriaceae bacterium]|nr:hypothetical protein [Abditibacteriaceae bacterium]
MRVIDHEPGAWFLLQDDNDYFLDVNCDRAMVSFSVTIKLNEAERQLYASEGRAYIVALADEVLGRSDPLDPRDIRDSALLERISLTIRTGHET